jgi:CubicO group peptidase (beta-lactamase class C family)
MARRIHQFNLIRRDAYDAAMQVPLDAWQVGPWNRWAYVNVGEVVATAPVPRGDGPVAPLERGDGGLDEVIEPLLETAYADGVAVVHKGRLVAERYGGEMAEASLHVSQSVGKSVLGLLVGILGIDTQELVSERVPEVAESGYAGATVQHLLDMTAAIDFVEDYEAFVRYDYACGWAPEVPGSPGTILEFLPTIGPAAWEHGERFHYATPNTDLLGLVAERVGGAPLAELFARELWGPMGAESDAALTVDPNGTAAIGGGFCATLRDYARLGALVAEGGRGIVPGAYVEQLGNGDASAWAHRTVPDIGGEGYGNQWWNRDGFTMARGIHGQLIAVSHETVVTVLSSWPAALDRVQDAAQLQAAASVAERLRP